MLHRYTDINYIFNLDYKTGAALILKAQEQELEARLFKQWTAQLTAMALSGKVMSFEAYKERATGSNIDRRPLSELEKDMDEVEAELKKIQEGQN